MTCTGRPCYWLKHHPGKDPGFVRDKDYGKPNFARRVNFNPKPTKFHDVGEISEEKLLAFKTMLEAKLPNCLWLYHLQVEPPVDVTSELEDHTTTPTNIYDELERVALLCSKALWLLNRVRKEHSRPFEIEGTRGQRQNPNWLKKRSLYCGGAVSQTITGLSLESAKIAFLRKHVHLLDRKITKPMQYGIDHEDIARLKYLEIMRASEPDIEVYETGSWCNPKYPSLSCSPDSLVYSPILMEWILHEIKVLTFEDVNPKKFYLQLTENQQKAFYLRRNSEGKIVMNRSHKYFRQIQHSLCVMEMETAHLFVWSKAGSLIVEVKRDETYFAPKRKLLIQRHRELIIPEHFLKRTLQHLPPIELNYTPFHEDENDDYFLNNNV